MVSDTRSHSRGSPHSLLSEQARMIRTEVVDTTNQIHTSVQAALSARQVAGAPGKASQPGAEGGVQALDKGGVEHFPNLCLLCQGLQLLLSTSCQSSAHLHAHTFASLRYVLFDHLSNHHFLPGYKRGSTRLACVHRRAKGSLHRTHIGSQPVHSYEQRQQ